MSADIATHPGSLEVAEPVPSRYAQRVGDIDVFVISDGVLALPAETMSTNAGPADRTAWLDGMFLPRDGFDWPLNVAVARSGTQTVLIDAGLGGEYPGFPRAGRLASRLQSAGIDLAAVTDIVLTHMHMDHIGGLLVDGMKGMLRTDLRIHVAAAEVAFWKAPDFAHTAMPPPVPDVLRSAATRFLTEYDDNLRLFQDQHEVAPGIIVGRTGGHTPGHSVVRIASRRDRLMFAGDALFPVGFDHPDWHNGFEHDPEEAARVRRGLLRELADSNEWLVATHLPFPSVGRVAAAGDVFRWVPVFWDY